MPPAVVATPCRTKETKKATVIGSLSWLRAPQGFLGYHYLYAMKLSKMTLPAAFASACHVPPLTSK